MNGEPNCSQSPYWHDDDLYGNASSSSGATPSPEQEFTCRLFDFLVETVTMGTLCAFGFVGNTLSAVCLRRDKSKSATPFLLISLALADTLFLATALLLRVVTSVPTFTGAGGPSGSHDSLVTLTAYIGKYVYPWAMIANTGTVYVTVLVTVNRYISVCKPYDASSLCSIPNARRQVVVVWLLSLLFNIPRFFEYQVVEIVDDCRPGSELRSVPTELNQNRVYQLVYLNCLYCLFMFLAPLVSLIALNYNLIMALRETRRRRETMKGRRSGGFHRGGGGGDLGPASSRSEDDITLMLIVVVVIFVVTQGPALVTQVLYEVVDYSCPSSFFFYQRISDLLVVANSSVNFIAYCFCSRRFRRILLSLLVRGRNAAIDLDPGGGEGGACTAATQTVEGTMTAATNARYGSHRAAGGDGGGRNGASLAFLRRLTERKAVLMNDLAAFELQETRPIVE